MTTMEANEPTTASGGVSDAQRAEIDELRTASAPTRRATVEALEEILYEPLPVLDHGFVRVIDYMGDDAAVVQAARVSYGRGTKKQRDEVAEPMREAEPPEAVAARVIPRAQSTALVPVRHRREVALVDVARAVRRASPVIAVASVAAVAAMAFFRRR